MTTPQTRPSVDNASDEIDLGKLLGILLDAKWFIFAITFIFAVGGVAVALLSTPIYKADALLQIEQKAQVALALWWAIWASCSRRNLPLPRKLKFLNRA